MLDEFGKDNILSSYSDDEFLARIETVKKYIDTGDVFIHMDYIEETLQMCVEEDENEEDAIRKAVNSLPCDFFLAKGFKRQNRKR